MHDLHLGSPDNTGQVLLSHSQTNRRMPQQAALAERASFFSPLEACWEPKPGACVEPEAGARLLSVRQTTLP